MNKKFLKIILVAIGILIVLGSWFWWRNVYSRDVLKLEILAVSEGEAGEKIDYTVRYKNNGNVRLENPRLIFEFPENSVLGDEFSNSEDERIVLRGDNKVEILLDEISPGEEKTKELSSYVFGKEGSTITAKATISFSPKNINAEYDAETTHTMVITAVPINFDIHLPSRVDAEKNFSFDINYFSRIDYPLSNLRIQVDYPSEFNFGTSRPSPSFESSEWEVGVLNKGEGGRIEVTGSLRGDPSQIRVFKASLGFWQGGKFVLLKESTRGVEIATPLLYITHRINERTQYVAVPDEYLHYEIFFRNTGEEPLEDLFMTAKLNRDTIDFDRVQAEDGIFQENNGTIIWDSRDVPELEMLAPMQEGKVSFWVRTKRDLERINPEVEVEISLGQVKKRIATKINTRLLFSQQAFFNQGPFENYGSLPPQTGALTSYTVRWRVRNTNNEVSDLKVRGYLPPEVRLSGEMHPDDAGITFDSSSREILWNIGTVEPGAEKEIYFQIVFNPSSDQIGDIAELVSDSVASGRDEWTETTVKSSSLSRNTGLPDDNSVSGDMGIVQ